MQLWIFLLSGKSGCIFQSRFLFYYFLTRALLKSLVLLMLLFSFWSLVFAHLSAWIRMNKLFPASSVSLMNERIRTRCCFLPLWRNCFPFPTKGWWVMKAYSSFKAKLKWCFPSEASSPPMPAELAAPIVLQTLMLMKLLCYSKIVNVHVFSSSIQCRIARRLFHSSL